MNQNSSFCHKHSYGTIKQFDRHMKVDASHWTKNALGNGRHHNPGSGKNMVGQSGPSLTCFLIMEDRTQLGLTGASSQEKPFAHPRVV